SLLGGGVHGTRSCAGLCRLRGRGRHGTQGHRQTKSRGGGAGSTSKHGIVSPGSRANLAAGRVRDQPTPAAGPPWWPSLAAQQHALLTTPENRRRPLGPAICGDFGADMGRQGVAHRYLTGSTSTLEPPNLKLSRAVTDWMSTPPLMCVPDGPAPTGSCVRVPGLS